MRISNENLLIKDGIATSTDMASSIDFQPIFLGHIANYSIQIVFTGTPTGSFKLQISNDEGFKNSGSPNTPTNTAQQLDIVNWTDVTDSQFAVSAAGNVAWEVENTGARWVRVVYTASSGSGTVASARANVKGV